MTHFTKIETPYGNFAAHLGNRSDDTDTRPSIVVTPIGELEELPLFTLPDGTTGLNHDALYDAAERLYGKAGILRQRPRYEINRAQYSETLRIVYGTYPDNFTNGTGGKDYAHVRQEFRLSGPSLTASAEKKLSAWFLEHRDEILTPEFLALSAEQAAMSELEWKKRELEQARKAEFEAERAHLDAQLAYEQARAAVVDLGA